MRMARRAVRAGATTVAVATSMALLGMPGAPAAGRSGRGDHPGTRSPRRRPVTLAGTVGPGAGATTSILYVVDTTRSTSTPTGSDCSGDHQLTADDDLNGDGSVGDVLDCEIAGVIALNSTLAAKPRVQAGLVAFANNAAAADLDPNGSATFLPPGYTGGDSRPRVETVARSVVGMAIGLYDPADLGDSGDGTAFNNAVRTALDTLAQAPDGPKWIMFLSDGQSPIDDALLDELTASGVHLRSFGGGRRRLLHRLREPVEDGPGDRRGLCGREQSGRAGRRTHRVPARRRERRHGVDQGRLGGRRPGLGRRLECPVHPGTRHLRRHGGGGLRVGPRRERPHQLHRVVSPGRASARRRDPRPRHPPRHGLEGTSPEPHARGPPATGGRAGRLVHARSHGDSPAGRVRGCCCRPEPASATDGRSSTGTRSTGTAASPLRGPPSASSPSCGSCSSRGDKYAASAAAVPAARISACRVSRHQVGWSVRCQSTARDGSAVRLLDGRPGRRHRTRARRRVPAPGHRPGPPARHRRGPELDAARAADALRVRS